MRGKPIKNIIGMKSGMVTVIAFSHSEGTNGTFWLCKCECGNEKIMRSSNIVQGKTLSCGCVRASKNSERNKIGKYTFKHGLIKTPEYSAWAGMRNRCFSKSHPGYKDYGGRGITVCERWNDFKNFLKIDEKIFLFLQHKKLYMELLWLNVVLVFRME